MVYDFFQNLVGAKRARKISVKEYIRPVEGDKVLDIGCGTGQLLRHLGRVQYTGFDLSAPYIQRAKSLFKGRGVFHCEDLNNLSEADIGKFDTVIGWGLLHHLDDSEVIRFLQLAKRFLKENGKVITFDGAYVENQNKAARYLISKDRGENIRTVERYRELLKKEFPKVGIAVRHDLLYIPYTHVIGILRLN